MTAAILDDLDYVVDASAVSLYAVLYVTGQISHVRRHSTMLVAQQKLEETRTHEPSGRDLTARKIAGNWPSQSCTKWISGGLVDRKCGLDQNPEEFAAATTYSYITQLENLFILVRDGRNRPRAIL